MNTVPIANNNETPRPRNALPSGGVLAFLGGMAISAALIAYHGIAAVSGEIWGIGWGLGPIVACHLLAVALCGVAWWTLLHREWLVSAGFLIVLRWIRESINTLLPVARVGGDIVGVRLLVLHGTEVNLASASLVADRTVEVFAQLFFAAAGILLLMGRGDHHDLLHWAIIGLIVICLLAAVLLLAQRWGLLRLLEKAVTKLAAGLGGGITGMHDAVWAIYGNGRRVAAATLLHTLGWTLGAVQIWFALYMTDQPIGWTEAFIIESLSQVVCTAAFLVPAALGAQEAGYMVIGELFGISPEMGLALSLVKRLSDVLAGIPGLLAWQVFEGRRLWVLRKRQPDQAERSSAM